jgi:hypothetical protein
MDRSGKLYRLELTEEDDGAEETSVYYIPKAKFALLKTALGEPDIYITTTGR